MYVFVYVCILRLFLDTDFLLAIILQMCRTLGVSMLRQLWLTNTNLFSIFEDTFRCAKICKNQTSYFKHSRFICGFSSFSWKKSLLKEQHLGLCWWVLKVNWLDWTCQVVLALSLGIKPAELCLEFLYQISGRWLLRRNWKQMNRLMHLFCPWFTFD